MSEKNVSLSNIYSPVPTVTSSCVRGIKASKSRYRRAMTQKSPDKDDAELFSGAGREKSITFRVLQ